MEQTHRESHLDPELDGLGPSGNEPGASTNSARATRATAMRDPGGWAQIEDPLKQSLLQVAERAIQGRFDGESDARNAVVESIVAQRYSAGLEPEQTEQIMRTLTATLAGDPTFCAEVDQMLLLAARELNSAR
jgi:hypothetical protein